MTTSAARRFSFEPDLPAFLDFAALSGFAIAQPVFAVLAGATDYLVFTDVSTFQIVALTVALILVLPVGLWLVEAIGAALFPRSRTALHRVLLGGLAAVIALQVVGATTSSNAFTGVALAAASGTFMALLHARWRPARLWTRLASPAPVVFAALFLFASPVTGLLGTSGSTPVAADTDAGATASPVILMVFDEFPLLTLLTSEGQIDGRLFPNLAALSREATFFRNATSVAARTTHSVPSILTGRFPRADLAPTSSQYPRNLFTLLESSHAVHAFESITSLCSSTACARETSRKGSPWQLFDVAFRILAGTVTPGATSGDSLGPWFIDEPGGEPARFDRFLESIDGDGTPFHFVHTILPHGPWQFLPDGLRYLPRDLGLVSYDERTEEPWPALVDHQRHVLQAMYVDGLVGRTVERLRAVGLYERSTLLVTADHGVSFQPGPSQGTRILAPQTAHEIAWVPFLLKTPGQTVGAVSDDNVMTVDVAPTLAELAGSRLPWPVDGMSLVAAPPRGAGKVWYNHPGSPLDLDGPTAYPKVVSGVAHEIARPEEGVEGMFRIGPFPDMVGTAPGDYPLVPTSDVVGRVDDLSSYEAVDIAAGIVPALVTGHLELPSDATRPAGVAIVLNGSIAAVSDLYGERDQPDRFAALASPSRMQSGPNSVELFLVDGGSDHLSLRSVEVRKR